MIEAGHLAGARSNISGLDEYATPTYCTRALMKREQFDGNVWECACGSGQMVSVIEKYNPCTGTDILFGVDFLRQDVKVDNIITNPPYKLALQFAIHGLKLTTKKLALFLRLNFLEGQGRYNFFINNPPKMVYVFSKRQTLSATGVTSGGTIAYAWYVWEKGYKGCPCLSWIND